MSIAAAVSNSYLAKDVFRVAPIPPPPTIPITADSLKLISKRYIDKPIILGIT